jgi:cytochrome c553
MLNKIQHDLFKNEDTLDTVLRVNKRNELVKNEIINVTQTTFLGKKALVSKLNKSTYFGKCSTCHEMCGVNIKPQNKLYPNKKGTTKQLSIFKKKFN